MRANRIVALAAREFVVLARTPRRVFFSIGLPLVVFGVVAAAFSDIPRLPPQYVSYSAYAAPMPIVFASVLGAVMVASNTSRDSRAGLILRARVLPMSPTDLVFGRACAEVAKSVVVAVVIFLLASILAQTPSTGLLGALLFIAVPVVLAVAMSFSAFTIGVRAKSPQAAQAALLPWAMAASLISTGLVPKAEFPDWIQPAITLNPVSAACDAMRYGLVPDAGRSLLILVVWVALAIGLSTRWLVRSYVRTT